MIIKMNNKYMVVISLDAVSSKDIEIMKELPNISKLMKEGALIKNVETVRHSKKICGWSWKPRHR